MDDLSAYKVLIVDDDQAILSSFERVFHRLFKIRTCADPISAIHHFRAEGPFATVISDMHMPGLDGIAFFSRIREIDPDPVRIMLTGDSDVNIAINAVNEGQIFRFLTKPCETKLMGDAIAAAIHQYRLITAEHELLEKTLKGSIQTLTEVLSMTNPVAFNKAKRISQYAVQIARLMKLRNLWQYEIAALLSQIGCITIPLETVEKYFSGLELTEEENTMIQAHPGIGYDLLINIPRMKPVATMIKLQHQLLPKTQYKKPIAEIETAILGGLILKSCIEFELLLTRNHSPRAAAKKMEETSAALIPELLDSFSLLEVMEHNASECKLIKIPELADGMLMADSILSRNGTLIVGKGCVINSAIRQRLFNFMRWDIIDNIAKIAIQK